MKKKVIEIVFIIIVCVSVISFILFLEKHKDLSQETYQVHRKCVSNEYIKGVDVSYYQKSIDWNIVKKSGIDFGFARVSDGTTKIDPKFVANWIDMKDSGIIRGAYQFFRPNQDPIDQAKLFIMIVESAGGFEENDLPSVIDVEITGSTPSKKIIENIIAWLNHVETYTKKKPIIYTGPYFWELNDLGNEFKEYPLWTAHYTKKDECPLIPDPWNNWTFWQFTGSGDVSGISTVVDINIFDGTRDDLFVFIKDVKVIHSESSIEFKEDDIKDAEPNIIDSEYDNINKEDDNNKEEDFPYEKGCECNIQNIKDNNSYYLIIMVGLLLIVRKTRR